MSQFAINDFKAERNKILYILLDYGDFYFALGRCAKCCDQRVCVYVCLSVCPHISKTKRRNLTKFSVHEKCSYIFVLFITAMQYVMYFRFYG